MMITAKPTKSLTCAMRIIAFLSLLTAALLLTGCSDNAAESKVNEELSSLRNSISAENMPEELRSYLTEDSKRDYEAFIEKVRDFDYEIAGCEKHSEGENRYTAVRVRIITYDFGSEYLRTWTEFLNVTEASETDKEGGSPEDADLKTFYAELFRKLAAASVKNYAKDVEIRVIEDSGADPVTDIEENSGLQDALFGGMTSEMKSLAGE